METSIVLTVFNSRVLVDRYLLSIYLRSDITSPRIQVFVSKNEAKRLFKQPKTLLTSFNTTGFSRTFKLQP